MPEQALDLRSLQQAFDRAVKAFDFPLPMDFRPYGQYIELLLKWNKAYNLTAIRQPSLMLSGHVLESLAVSPYVVGDRCLDIGTGAGVPGLILAIAHPGQSWTLLDSNIKKTRFVRQVVMQLGLHNVDVVHSRLEDFDEHAGFDCVICRAFTSLSGFYQSARPLIHVHGQLLAMKSAFPEAELAQLKKLTDDVTFHAIKVPGVEPPRGLVVCC